MMNEELEGFSEDKSRNGQAILVLWLLCPWFRDVSSI